MSVTGDLDGTSPRYLRDKYAIVGVGETAYMRGSGKTTVGRELAKSGLSLVGRALRRDVRLAVEAIPQLGIRQRPQRLEIETIPRELVRQRNVAHRQALVSRDRDDERQGHGDDEEGDDRGDHRSGPK